MAEPVDEWVDDAPADEWVDDAPAPTAQAAQPVTPAVAPPVPEAPGFWDAAIQRGAKDLTQSIEGSLNARAQKPEGFFNTLGAGINELAGPPLAVLGAPIKEAKERYLNPVITAAQDKFRPLVEPELAKIEQAGNVVPGVGTGVRALAEDLFQLGIGPAEKRNTPEQMDARYKAVADLPSNLGMGDQPTLAAGAQALAGEAAFLPLYLIDAPAKAGPVANALVGGGLSETLDPREGADPLRGALMTGGLGAGLQAGISGGQKLFGAAKKAHAAVTWLRSLDGAVAESAQKALNVTPAEEIGRILDAPADAPLLAGAKKSATVLDVNPAGEFVSKPIALKHGNVPMKLEGKERVGPMNPNAGEVVVASKRAVEKAKAEGVPLPKNVIVAEAPLDEAIVRGPGDAAPGEVLEGGLLPQVDAKLQQLAAEMKGGAVGKDAATGQILFDEDAIPRLHELPQKDTIVSWDDGTGTLKLERMTAEQIQLKALEERRAVLVSTPFGPRIGEVRLIAEGQVLVKPFDAAEKMPGNLMESGIFPQATVRPLINDGKPSNALKAALSERRAVLEAEAEAAQLAAVNAADTQAAVELAPQGVLTVETPTGPKVALSVYDAPPMQPEAVAAPPGAPPDGPGGGFSGVPPPPMPPNPGMIDRNVPDKANWVQQFLTPSLLPPTVTGPLDATAAATMIASARNVDALRGRVDAASRRMMRPILSGMSPEAVRKMDSATVEFLEGRKSLTDLLREHPQLEGEAAQHWEATRARSQQIEAILQERGMVPKMTFVAPGGGQAMLDFVRQVKRSRAYLMQPYYAHTLESGAWAKYVKRNEAEYKTIVDRYVDEVVMPKYRNKQNPIDKDSARAIAERELDNVLRDPDAMAEKWNVEVHGGTKRADGVNALKPKAAAGLEEALVIMGKRAESWTAGQRDAAYRFVAGAENEKELLREFASVGDGEKDLQFLRETQKRADTSLPGWLKMALGPVESPVTRASFSVEAQEELLMRSEALETLVRAGAVLPEDALATVRPSALNGPATERWVKIPDDVRKYGNHSGKYVHPSYSGFLYYDEARDGFQNLITRFLAPIARGWKLAQTALSQGSYLVNVMGNLNGFAMSGTMPLSDLLNPNRAPASFVESIQHWQDFTKSPNKLSTPEVRSGADWIRDSIKYGAVSSDFVGAEFRQTLDKWGRMSFPGERKPANVVDYLLAVKDAAKSGGTKTLKAYASIDPFLKHVNWLNGVKRAGVDVTSGKLVDREAAVSFLKGWGGDETILRSMSDVDLAERVKAGNGRVIAESHPQPDRMARLPRSIAQIGDATGPLDVVNQFYRTGSEVLRTHMMMPYRLFTRPGVASSMMQYAMLAAAVGAGITAMKRRMGIDPESERQSFMALPVQLRRFRPGAFALPVPKDGAGRVTYVDLGRMFDAVKFLNGDVGGRPLLEGLSESPGQTMRNVAYNMTSTALGFGGNTDAMIRNTLEDAGFLPQVPDKQNMQPGTTAALDKMWKYAAPGFARTALKAVQQSTPSQFNPQPASGLRTGVELLTGGVVFQGGTQRDSAQQGRKAIGEMNKAMKPTLTREGQPLGPFQRFDKQQANEQRREKVQQIRDTRR